MNLFPYFDKSDAPTPPPTAWHLSAVGALSVGILLTVVGSGVMAVGSVVMKIGIHEDAERTSTANWENAPQQQQSAFMAGLSPLRSPTWWFGISLYSAGALLHVAGLAFAPASVLAPLNAVGLVANAGAAVLLLGETMHRKEIACTGATVVGVVLCSLTSFLQTAEDAERERRIVDGTDCWRDTHYLLYFAACALCLVGCLLGINGLEVKHHDAQVEALFQAHVAGGHIEMVSTAAALRSNGPLAQQFLTATPPHGSTALMYIGLLYSISSGIVGAQFVLQLKELTVLLPDSAVWRSSVQPYVCFLFGLISIFLQMHLLNLALGCADATVVVPAYYVAWTLFGTFGGWAKFHEMFGFTFWHFVIFSAGLAVTLLSIVLLAFAASAEREDGEAATDSTVGRPAAATDAADAHRRIAVTAKKGGGQSGTAAFNLLPLVVALQPRHLSLRAARMNPRQMVRNGIEGRNCHSFSAALRRQDPHDETDDEECAGSGGGPVGATMTSSSTSTTRAAKDGGAAYSPVPPGWTTASQKKPKSLTLISYQ